MELNAYRDTWGKEFNIPFTLECYAAGDARIILPPGLLKDKGVRFTIGPNRSFVTLKNGTDVELTMYKKTFPMEATHNSTHPHFRPTAGPTIAPLPKTSMRRNNKHNASFQRQGRET